MKTRQMQLSIVLLLLVAVFIFPVNADITEKYNFDPFYRSGFNKNTEYNYRVSIMPIDNIYRITTAIINLQVFTTNQPTDFIVRVNNILCNTQIFSLRTQYAGNGQYMISFDCSNAIKKYGIYNVTVTSSSDTGNVNAWLDLSYSSNPVRKLDVSGTEYFVNQNGTIFIQSDTDTAICEATIFSPNKTLWVNAPMTYISNSTHIYYYDFVVPSTQGVYVAEASCKTPLINRSNVKTFFANESTFNVLVNSTPTANLYVLDPVGSGNERCVPHFHDVPDYFGGDVRLIKNITNINLFLETGGASALTRIRLYFNSHNFITGQHTDYGFSELNSTVTGPILNFTLPNFLTPIQLTEHEIFSAEVCLQKTGTAVTYTFRWGGTTPSNFTRELGGINLTNPVIYHGSTEIHINPPPLGVFDFSSASTRIFVIALFVILVLIVIYVAWRYLG